MAPRAARAVPSVESQCGDSVRRSRPPGSKRASVARPARDHAQYSHGGHTVAHMHTRHTQCRRRGVPAVSRTVKERTAPPAPRPLPPHTIEVGDQYFVPAARASSFVLKLAVDSAWLGGWIRWHVCLFETHLSKQNVRAQATTWHKGRRAQRELPALRILRSNPQSPPASLQGGGGG